MKHHYARTLLDAHGGNKTAAAKAAGVHPRTLGRWLEQDPAVAESMKAANTKLVPSTIWIKSKTHSIQLKPPPTSETDDFIDRLKEAFTNINAAPSVVAPEGCLDDLLTAQAEDLLGGASMAAARASLPRLSTTMCLLLPT